MNRTPVGRIAPGQVWRYHCLHPVRRNGGAVIEDVEGDSYSVLGFGYDGVTMADRVIITGLEGPNQGRYLIYSLMGFVTSFRLVEAPAPERVAGQVTQGTGV